MNQFHIWIGKCGIVVAHPINLPLSNTCPIRHSQASLDEKNNDSSTSDECGAIVLSRRPQSHPDLFRSIIFNPRDRSLCLNKTLGIESAVIDGFRGKNVAKKLLLFQSAVVLGLHPFVGAVHQAYADHRPLVLSPDMFWLLVTQGLASHINNQLDDYRGQFGASAEKELIEVRHDGLCKGALENPWEEVFDQLSFQIRDRIGEQNHSACHWALQNQPLMGASKPAGV